MMSNFCTTTDNETRAILPRWVLWRQKRVYRVLLSLLWVVYETRNTKKLQNTHLNKKKDN